jgi:hypothetical protein
VLKNKTTARDLIRQREKRRTDHFVANSEIFVERTRTLMFLRTRSRKSKMICAANRCAIGAALSD